MPTLSHGAALIALAADLSNVTPPIHNAPWSWPKWQERVGTKLAPWEPHPKGVSHIFGWNSAQVEQTAAFLEKLCSITGKTQRSIFAGAKGDEFSRGRELLKSSLCNAWQGWGIGDVIQQSLREFGQDKESVLARDGHRMIPDIHRVNLTEVKTASPKPFLGQALVPVQDLLGAWIATTWQALHKQVRRERLKMEAIEKERRDIFDEFEKKDRSPKKLCTYYRKSAELMAFYRTFGETTAINDYRLELEDAHWVMAMGGQQYVTEVIGPILRESLLLFVKQNKHEVLATEVAEQLKMF